MPPVLPTKPKAKRKQKEPTRAQLTFMVEKFVQKNKIIWPREVAIAKNLWAKYPKYQFWYILPDPFQMPSLAGFLTKKAADFLKLEWAKFNLQLPVEVTIIQTNPTPVVEERLFAPRKPRTLLDFCK